MWWQSSRQQPLLLAVDDVHRIDPASAAVLAGVLDKAARGRLFMLLSADSDERADTALEALARRCHVLQLEPLTHAETQRLLGSLFGDVPNLELLTRELHAVAGGVPRACMDVAQHLVDRGLIRYASGQWTLPTQLSSADLPHSAAEAVRARVAQLSPTARFVAEAQALAFTERLSVRQYRALLPGANSQLVERAIAELLSQGVLIGDSSGYALPNRLWIDALASCLPPEHAAERHRALAGVYEANLRPGYLSRARGRHG